MKLNERLKKIALMIDKCNTVIDIGTDHGYLPVYLIENNICNFAIATDINIGPVKKAIFNIEIQGLSDKVECRLGSGFLPIKVNEAQCAVIAGMGGNLIRDIIDEKVEIFKSLDYLILNPIQNPEILRKYIYNKGFKIVDEELCIDENKYYEIIKIKYDNNPQSVENIFYEISKILIEKKHPLIGSYIDSKISKYNKIYRNIKNDSSNSINRKNEVKDKIDELKELRKECP